ncbi:DNA-directed RNA polymerase III subunit C11 [Monoraphidium neglectum]|uniref:DNA-directed RNA polymerase subunit n=1 Tax=Monoraphidium neglectum TaxID=145388 RepID=A0A0D2KKP7_9CHLO|nr:DNA-directed RNA polymerase III subunit C11 [Monoraphidium neglectum]KIY96363.1 DNA-directed RNA polymerase III subunit C11 [Monoraphidium neglectum]|eukprot:XP_013895383.1 DNA-directed RNA polymerase III subunit C11 [Monoraphidium neglectum]
MIAFCPTCGNMLLVELEGTTSGLRYFCQTCPYVFDIQHTIRRRSKLTPKKVEDLFDETKMWANAQKTTSTVCPACRNNEAYFYEMQTRSADEPATVFLRCCNNNCKKVWSEN